MAKLWDTMKTLEGSAENREVKLEECNMFFGVCVFWLVEDAEVEVFVGWS